MSISYEINHCYSYNHHFYLYHQCVYQCVLIVITSMVTSSLAASDNVYHLPHLLASSSPSSSLLNSISSTSSFRNNNHDRSASSGLNNQRAKCETTLNTCSREMRCAMALQDYRTSCSHLLNNKTRTCSESCRLALISLNSLPEGYDYLNCDCGDNEFCRKVRRRTSVCHLRFNNHLTSPSAPSSSSTSGSTLHGINFPLDSIPPASPSTHSNRGQATLGSPFSSPSASSLDSHHRYKGKQTHHGSMVLCSTAEARCKEDETCSEAWEFFQVHCEKVFTGTECTKSCNNSLNILYRQRAAHHLDNCICSENSIPFSSRSPTPFTLTLPTFSSSSVSSSVSSSSSSSSSSSTNSFNEWSCKRRKANIKRLCFGYSSPSALSGIASRSNSFHHSINLYQLLTLQFIPIVSLIILNTILSVK